MTRSNCAHRYHGSYTSTVYEESWFHGHLVSNIFYGVQITLSVMAFFTVLRRRASKHGRMRIYLLVYITSSFVVSALAQGFLVDLIQMAFITKRDYPGGPSAFLTNACHVPSNLASNILVVLSNWMMEFLLVWRCHVVCSVGDQLWWLGVAVPSVLLVAVFITGSLFIYHIVRATPPAAFFLSYAVSSLALNFAATGFIAGRLLYLRHQIIKYYGQGHGQQYVSVASVVVESAAIYTTFLVLLIVAYASGSPAINFLQQNIEQVQSIASLLTILRIARGEGWSTSTESALALVSHTDQSAIRLDVTTVAESSEETAKPIVESRSYDERKRHVKSRTWTI